VIVLVPISRFRITYEIAAGRPFSWLERMILRAIQEGASELAVLQKTFEVHPRLLIEGLVTLTHAGWLAIGGPGHEGFVLTSGGREAAGSDQPPSTTEVSSRHAFVIMERLTGALISNFEVRFVSRKELDDVWDQTVRLAPEVPDNRLDEAQVQHLLPRRQGEWVRWIGPIDMMSKNAHWLPVNADLDTDTVVGLPDAWLPRLRATIMDEARRVVGSLSEEGRTCNWTFGGPWRIRMASGEADPEELRVPPPGWPVALSKDDIYFTADEHEKLVATALSEARNSILIASAFANIGKLEVLRAHVEAALKRGVSVDLLWGYMAIGTKDGSELVDWLRKLAYNAKRDGKGVLRFNQVPSGSHGKLLLWDRPSGFTACIGSYNWLSALIGQAGITDLSNVTIRISEPAVVAALARCAAALWSGAESEMLSSTGDRWRRIAADLDMAASRADSRLTNAKVRLSLDGEHEVLLREWMRTAQARLLIASHKLGAASEIRLVSADVQRPDSFVFDVLYGRSDEDEARLKRVAELVRKMRGVFKYVPELHAKVVVSDASACVTSYNFLSADPFGTAKNAREFGLVIEGREPADWVWNRFHEEWLEDR